MTASAQGVWNLPNALSLFRIALIPLILYFLSDSGRGASAIAGALFFIASLSDFFDGYLARRAGTITTLGKYLDPLADKLIVATALIMLVGMVREPRVPTWLVALIIGRELEVTGLRAIAASEGLVLGAEELGKYKMIFQTFALHGLIIHYTYGPSFFRIDFHAAGMVFLWVSTLVGLWSAVDYHIRVISALTARRHTGAAPSDTGAMRQAS
jgi:CDP-diacylglycerol--glycerol-3-phosphate 3-phosphatidyltransferase